MVLQTLVYDGKAEWQPSNPDGSDSSNAPTELGRVYRAIMRPGQPAAIIRAYGNIPV